jgi:hypothetical protein
VAAKDLITEARADYNLNGLAAGNATVQALITSYSEMIEKYCRRRFVSHAFDELYNGNGQRRLLLREYPIQSVQSVRYRPVYVLYIQNNLPATNQQARVSVTSTGLKLFRMASGVSNSDTSVTWALYPTINAVATAVNALGNGWTAQIVGDAATQVGQHGDYGLWPSADLYVPNSYGDALEGVGILESQGAIDARGINAGLLMHTYELQGYQWDARGWLLRAIPYTDPEMQHPEDLVWPVGINNFRVQYTAGYTTVPEAVQEACARWVAYAYYLTLRDPLLKTQVPASGTSSGWGPNSGPLRVIPDDVAGLLAPYRRHVVGIEQG